jgi:hypothetical protein
MQAHAMKVSARTAPARQTGGSINRFAVAMQNNQVPRIIATATQRSSALMALQFYGVLAIEINLQYTLRGERNPRSAALPKTHFPAGGPGRLDKLPPT